jgi:hypothetical protein
MKHLTYAEYVTLKSIEEAFEGKFMLEKYEAFTKHFLEEIKDYDKVTIAPEIAPILVVADELYPVALKSYEGKGTNFVGYTKTGNKEIYVGLK